MTTVHEIERALKYILTENSALECLQYDSGGHSHDAQETKG